MLAEVFVKPVGLTQEERDMSFGSLQKFPQGNRRLFEFGREFVVFVVSPGLSKVLKHGLEACQSTPFWQRAKFADERLLVDQNDSLSPS